MAAMGGDLELLKWLRDKGCPWSSSNVTGASYSRDDEVLE